MRSLFFVFTILVFCAGCAGKAKAQENSDGKSSTTAELNRAAYRGELEKVRKMLKTNPDPDGRDSYGGTALHAAMFQDNTEVAKILLEYGFDVNAVGPSNGYTPLHDAVWANNLKAAKLLCENGADMTIQGHDGFTPLEKAEREGKKELAAYLRSRQ